MDGPKEGESKLEVLALSETRFKSGLDTDLVIQSGDEQEERR
ncbi:MAG: hypothetical protein NTW24_05995 [Proteobacteria bacterium]|nr:hypothetical protein [Pseudomonadota bacterium]